jgi:hypothetical protein
MTQIKNIKPIIATAGAFLMAILCATGIVAAVNHSSVATAAVVTRHYIANDGGYYPQVAALGFNVIDISSSPSLIATLPAGTQGMVWMGSGQKCPQPLDSAFESAIDGLVGNAKVYGFYLSDEPTVGSACPDGPTNIEARVAYVKAKMPSAQTFIVLDDQPQMAPYSPAKTGVDLVGLDPYPCNVNSSTCDLTKIDQKVGWATSAGIPTSAIVPTFQAFGQENTSSPYYRLPSVDEYNAIMAQWAKDVPDPQLDYAYGWKNQPDANPTLIDSAGLQAAAKAHNGATSTPTPPPTTTASQPPTSTPVPPPTTTTQPPTSTTQPPVTVTVTAPPVTVTAPPVTITKTVMPTNGATELDCPLAALQNAAAVTCHYK